MKLCTVVGARPQFIKASALSKAVSRLRDEHGADISEMLVHTGQHFDADMSDVFFEELGIPAPAVNLGIHGGGHGAMTGRMLEALERCFLDLRPDVVLVYGDTNSTLAAALAAAKLHLPLAHVEAGLRSYNMSMPEEINRRLTDHVSRWLLCPTATAVQNLAKEGITAGVSHPGDVMYDVALGITERADQRAGHLAARGLGGEGHVLLTLHRAENTASHDRLNDLLAYVREQAQGRPVVFPVHPRTQQQMANAGMDLSGFRLCPPLSYLDITCVLRRASEVFTDSGGLQKEAWFHRVPCVTLREETEWPETIECGWNRLWRVPEYRPRRPIDAFGSGDAATLILKTLLAHG